MTNNTTTPSTTHSTFTTFDGALAIYQAKYAAQEKREDEHYRPAIDARKAALAEYGAGSPEEKAASEVETAEETAMEPFYDTAGEAALVVLLAPASTFSQIETKYQIMDDEGLSGENGVLDTLRADTIRAQEPFQKVAAISAALRKMDEPDARTAQAFQRQTAKFDEFYQAANKYEKGELEVANRTNTDVSYHETVYGALHCQAYEHAGDVVSTPAPDADAIVTKLQLLIEFPLHQDPEDDAHYIEAIIADFERLVIGGAA